jgi:acetyl-CoA carboxylase carboxyl transferase alpha subunit/acetyl-CoA carboxylase carboxyl transferase beta subunit
VLADSQGVDQGSAGEQLTDRRRPDPAWVRCAGCQTLVYGRRYTRGLGVCPQCGHHGRLGAAQRLALLLDRGWTEAALTALPADPLHFTDLRPYGERLREARTGTGLDEAVVVARGTLHGEPVVAAVMDFDFLGGSVGCAAGELITRAAEIALAERTPLLMATASGGARMQEGVYSLMQMAKTAQALAALDEAGILTITLVTDPTFGGVAASFATLADMILAEPGARMGFAGPRVIEQTTGHRLPAGFQTADFLFAHGLIDAVLSRPALRPALARLLGLQTRADPVSRPSRDLLIRDGDLLPERDAWEAVRLARHAGRPTTLDYAAHLLDWFQELHGDRMHGDCPAVVGGVGRLLGVPVMLIGQQKGRNTSERLARRFGMASPEGHRKAARLMRLAAKVGIPVVTFIDTPGAEPGVEAEERGQAMAIAENLRLMSGLPVPVVAVITGEGGSGGALALGVADRVLACENAVYSVISPEGCAAILWRDTAFAPAAAAALRLDARALLAHRIVDGVVPEPAGGAHTDPVAAAGLLREALGSTLQELLPLSRDELVRRRRRRFREYGRAACAEVPAAGPVRAPLTAGRAGGAPAGTSRRASPNDCP